MVTLVMAIDRDNDLGRKTGIRSPVIGREANLTAAQELGLADPEESDTNTMLAAVRVYDQLLKEGIKVEVVTICGDIRVGTRSDMKIANTLDRVIAQTHATRAVMVSDGAEDRELEPIIRSRLLIDSTRQVVVQQSRPIEDTLYTIIHKMEDPKIQRKFILPLALVMLVGGLMVALNQGGLAIAAIFVTLGSYMLIKVAGWEEEIRRFYYDALTGTSERVSFYTYLFAGLIIIIGIFEGYEEMDEAEDKGLTAQVLAFISINGLLGFLLGGIVLIEIGRAVDTYLREGIFNVNIIRFIFTVVSFGLIVAGSVSFLNRRLVEKEPFAAEQMMLILAGIILAFIGFLVHDSIRERQEQSLPGEE